VVRDAGDRVGGEDPGELKKGRAPPDLCGGPGGGKHYRNKGNKGGGGTTRRLLRGTLVPLFGRIEECWWFFTRSNPRN